MGFGDKAKAFATEHKHDASLEGYMLNGSKIKRGLKSWPVAGAKADFEHGANIGSRITATRVMLTGIFALGLKKDRNKVYVMVELADGEQLLVETKAKEEVKARKFAASINAASDYFASPPA